LEGVQRSLAELVDKATAGSGDAES
jgi:hypothetical protein